MYLNFMPSKFFFVCLKFSKTLLFTNYCCLPLSQVTWSSPPLAAANGVIKGYKVVFGPSATWYDPSTRDTKVSADTRTELTGLKKYTNYTVQGRTDGIG